MIDPKLFPNGVLLRIQTPYFFVVCVTIKQQNGCDYAPT